jgi:hypothetical protein
MARVTVYLPDAVLNQVREQLPGLNVSAVVRDALSGLLRCDHTTVVCPECSATLKRSELNTAAVRTFWCELAEGVEQLVWSGATAEGAAAVLWRTGREWDVTSAQGPLPRPTRAEREAARERRERGRPNENELATGEDHRAVPGRRPHLRPVHDLWGGVGAAPR